MLIIILKIAMLLAVIIIPLTGPSKKPKLKTFRIDTDITHAHYAVNEEGNLVEIHPELSRYAI